MPPTARHLVVGCGYVGTRLARTLLPRGPVVGVTSGTESAARLETQGLDAVAWNLDTADTAPPRGLGTASIVYYLVPPPATGTADPRVKRFLARLPTAPARLVYISTTGVYGDAQGGVVTEDTPVNPGSERAARRVDAEQAVRTWATRQGVAWTILRVPGIYGPGRLPLERIRRAEPMIRHSEAGYSSRIHVDDLVAACVMAGASPRAVERVYNVTDGNPASLTEYFERVATLAGLPTPPLVSREEAERVLSPGLLSYLAESRRVDGTRIREELGFAPRFTDLRLGILSSLPMPR